MSRWCNLIVITFVWFALGTAQAAPSVAVDLSRLDSQAADAAALEQALVMRLLQEGFAIDPLTAEPTIVVAIAGHDHELVLTAKSAHFARSRTIDISGASDVQLRLELAQRVVELARQAREAAPRVAAASAEPRADVDVRAAGVVVEERAPRWRIGIDVGVLSSNTIEPSLHARYAIGRGFGAVLRGGFTREDARDIDVGEQEVVAGAGYERPLVGSLALDVAALAGARRHHFEVAMPLVERAGTRWDPALVVPVRFALRPGRNVELSIWGVAKVATAREHVNGSAVLWRRDALGVGLGAGVAARF